MKTIELSQGMQALVDDEDYERFGHLNWCVMKSGNRCYAVHPKRGHDGRSKTYFLHKYVMRWRAYPDHRIVVVNGNPLDCRRQNLCLVRKHIDSSYAKEVVSCLIKDLAAWGKVEKPPADVITSLRLLIMKAR